MNSPSNRERETLSPVTSSFVLSAAITVLFNTGLAWAKDAYPSLNSLMKSLSGHHWTTHGVVDLLLFIGFGLAFTKTRVTEKMDPNRLIGILVGAVVISGLGLALWYGIF
jgi:hypothetical protein